MADSRITPIREQVEDRKGWRNIPSRPNASTYPHRRNKMMEKIVLIGSMAVSVMLLMGICGLYKIARQWREVLKVKNQLLDAKQNERLYSQTLEQKMRKLEGELEASKAEAVYWEGLTRKFEDEVMKIATGKG